MTASAREVVTIPSFAQQLIAWQAQHGRHDLPWQNTRDPYRIWVSEIMLQQTQVATVIPYYARFLESFPDVYALANAPQDHVLAQWSGLGYYSRARNLHAAARLIAQHHKGQFPRTAEALRTLPGIGASTAAAIAAFAYGARGAILDGNVKRVLTRCFGIAGYPGDKLIEAQLWRLANALLPTQDIAVYTQALMDFGATLCTRAQPRCAACPLQLDCYAYREHRVRDLPTRKSRPAVPQRATVMLVLQHHAQVLLEKRPATGIWGGMWSFPEVTAQTVLDEYVRGLWATRVIRVAPLPVLHHRFTHFHLEIAVLWVQVSAPYPNENARWLSLEAALQAAIPTPARHILNTLQKLTPITSIS